MVTAIITRVRRLTNTITRTKTTTTTTNPKIIILRMHKRKRCCHRDAHARLRPSLTLPARLMHPRLRPPTAPKGPRPGIRRNSKPAPERATPEPWEADPDCGGAWLGRRSRGESPRSRSKCHCISPTPTAERQNSSLRQSKLTLKVGPITEVTTAARAPMLVLYLCATGFMKNYEFCGDKCLYDWTTKSTRGECDDDQVGVVRWRVQDKS